MVVVPLRLRDGLKENETKLTVSELGDYPTSIKCHTEDTHYVKPSSEL